MDQDTLIIGGTAAGLVLVAIAPFYLRTRRLERRATRAAVEAERYGLHEPVSLHPVVHAGACIGTGACIDVCPEGDVLGLVHGQARPIAPARCVGHGLCERACPVEAIQLVFGTATRGVELPRVRADFQTNVPGLYVIGELGGMGLIRNAFEQGRQCVDGIARAPRPGGEDLEVLIVGAGPAGLSASLACRERGLRFATIEREDIGGTVRSYPRKKVVMTRPFEIPGWGKIPASEVPKERLMEIWSEVVERTGLSVTTGTTVQSVTRQDDGRFTVETSGGTWRAHRVVLAIGRRGIPRKLGVPGEELPKVSYSLLEPEAWQGDRIVVVGGGDSAVEAALALADQPGNQVTVSYRRDRFNRLKPGNLDRVEHAISDGTVTVLWESRLEAIAADRVTWQDKAGARHELLNDRVFIFAGGELPSGFLKDCGIIVDTKFGEA